MLNEARNQSRPLEATNSDRSSPTKSDGPVQGSGSADAAQTAASAATDTFSPAKENYHHYQAGPNIVCPAELKCTSQEIADQMSRFAVPGQHPDQPVQSGQTYPVYAPVTGEFVGNVKTTISEDGLTTQNVTKPGHLLYDGQITRKAEQNSDGSWSVTTTGTGNNVIPGMATANELAGPSIFDSLDQQMRQNILLHHGQQ